MVSRTMASAIGESTMAPGQQNDEMEGSSRLLFPGG